MTSTSRGCAAVRLPLAATFVAALLAAVGCGKREAEVAPTQPAAVHGIEWYAGSVEQAFDEAASRNLPIFLYWGAEWCPPCHEIKATVFRSREFIERSRLFIPVYLDGDAENAQALGERFGVRGYPTMIVFSPAGEEITRIPGGIDIQAYANVLDLALGSMKPVAGVLARVLDEGGRLDAAECRLMAYYSWEQNPALTEGRDRTAMFEKLGAACPEESRVERSMLFMSRLESAVAAAKKEADAKSLDPDLAREARARLPEVLADPALLRANLYAVVISGPSIAAAITESGSPERAALEAGLGRALEQVAGDDSLFRTDRLYALIGKIRLARIDAAEAPLTDALVAEIRSTVGDVDAATTDPYERQSVINVASAVLEMADLKEEAKTMLLAELDRSKQPYYFMTSLADLEQQAGNHDAAIGWLARGYDESRGPATRFQRGTYYLLGLLEMTPEDDERIRAETVRVVGELGAARAFHQRPKAQLARLQKQLEEWNADGKHAAAIAGIRQGVLAVCAGIPADTAERATCEAFLAPVPVAAGPQPAAASVT